MNPQPSNIPCMITRSIHRQSFAALALCLLTALLPLTSLADALRVSTCNTYFLFRPEYDGGQLRHKGPSDRHTYDLKVENLVRLIGPSDVIALQEVGSETEVEDFAKVLGGAPVFVAGRDTYTGENVGFVHFLPNGYRAVHRGRVGMLERELSKHLLLVIDGPTTRFNILNVHLVVAARDPRKNAAQRAAIVRWIEAALRQEPTSTFLVVGDMNYDYRGPALALGRDVLEPLRWPYTHSSRLTLDHMIAVGNATWENPIVSRPPYGPRPNEPNKVLWTDHFAVTGTVVTP